MVLDALLTMVNCMPMVVKMGHEDCQTTVVMMVCGKDEGFWD